MKVMGTAFHMRGYVGNTAAEEEMPMKDGLRVICAWILLWGFAESIGCASTVPLSAPPSTPVSISKFDNVSGKWLES